LPFFIQVRVLYTLCFLVLRDFSSYARTACCRAVRTSLLATRSHGFFLLDLRIFSLLRFLQHTSILQTSSLLFVTMFSFRFCAIFYFDTVTCIAKFVPIDRRRIIKSCTSCPIVFFLVYSLSIDWSAGNMRFSLCRIFTSPMPNVTHLFYLGIICDSHAFTAVSTLFPKRNSLMHWSGTCSYEIGPLFRCLQCPSLLIVLG